MKKNENVREQQGRKDESPTGEGIVLDYSEEKVLDSREGGKR